jgi:hypothetical protein
VVTKRLEHELAALKKRLHILEGFEKIFDALDDILKIVRKSEGKADAAQQIMKKYDLDAEQTDAILEHATFPIPSRAINNDAVVRVEACGVCRSDWHLWQEDWAWVGVEHPTEVVRGKARGHADPPAIAPRDLDAARHIAPARVGVLGAHPPRTGTNRIAPLVGRSNRTAHRDNRRLSTPNRAANCDSDSPLRRQAVTTCRASCSRQYARRATAARSVRFRIRDPSSPINGEPEHRSHARLRKQGQTGRLPRADRPAAYQTRFATMRENSRRSSMSCSSTSNTRW